MSLIIRDFMQLPLTRGSLWDSSNLGSEFPSARHEFLAKYHFRTTESDRRSCFKENIKQGALWAHATLGDLLYIWLLSSTDPYIS